MLAGQLKSSQNPLFSRVICKEKERNRKNFAASCKIVPGYFRDKIILGQLPESCKKVTGQLQERCGTYYIYM